MMAVLQTLAKFSTVSLLAIESLFLFFLARNALKDVARLKIRSKIARNMGREKFLKEQQDYLENIRTFINTKNAVDLEKVADEFDLFLIDLNFRENVKRMLAAQSVHAPADDIDQIVGGLKRDEFMQKLVDSIVQEYSLENELPKGLTRYLADRYMKKMAAEYLRETKRAIELATA